MRTFLTSLLCLLVLGLRLHAQECEYQVLGPATEPFKGITVGTTLVSKLTIRNMSVTLMPITIDSISVVDAHPYETVVLENTVEKGVKLASGSFYTFTLVLKIRHNMPLSFWIVIHLRCDCGPSTVLYHVAGWATAPGYEYTDNREYSDLYDSLHAHVINHTSLGYKPAREVMFGKADNVNDSVECIYTGKKLKTAGIPPNGEFNTEHSWVQSRGSSVEPNKSDINHLYPTNPNANSIRANYPFGNVVTQWRDAGGGSRLGFTAHGDTVFEPRDVSKGNIARSMFYYLVRYGNVTDYYRSPYSMDADLREWNRRDPPDDRERKRCDTIAAYQMRRNPLVDHPEFVERLEFIPTIHTDAIRCLQRTIVFDTAFNSNTYTCTIVNRFADTLHYARVVMSHPAFVTLISPDSTMRHDAHQALDYTFRIVKGKGAFPARMMATVIMSDSSRDSVVFIQCQLVGVHDDDADREVQPRPQPMSTWCELDLGAANEQLISAQVYSMSGELLLDATHTVTVNNGRYILHLSADQMQRERAVVLHSCVGRHTISRVVLRED